MSKWKLVPVEATDEMIRAIDGLICSSYLWPVYAYRAMIDAAPVQQTDPLGYFTFNKEWNVWEQMSAKYKNASDATPLYLHPPSAELARLRAENERLKADAAPCVPKMTDAEMVHTESWQSIADELAHAAYLRGIEEGKRQGLAPQDRSSPARHEDMAMFAAELKADPAKARTFFQEAGILTESGALTPEYGGPQEFDYSVINEIADRTKQRAKRLQEISDLLSDQKSLPPEATVPPPLPPV